MTTTNFLYHIYTNDFNKPICLSRTNTKTKKEQVISGLLPDKNSNYCKTLIADNCSSFSISYYIEAIQKYDNVISINKAKGRRIPGEELKNISLRAKNQKENGLSNRKIAANLGCSEKTIRRLLAA